MAEIGLVKLAAVALRGGPAVLPAQRRNFATRQVTPPQRLAILGVRREEDWTFRDAAVRLADHHELDAALGLQRVPDDTPLCRLLRQLDEPLLEQTLRAVVGRLMPQTGLPATVAVEATGLTPGAISTCFVTRAKEREPGFTWRHWRNWTTAVEVDPRIILAQPTRRGPTNDCATLRSLVDTAPQHGPMGLVLADAEFDSARHHQHVRHLVPAHSVMPAQRGSAKWHIRGIQAHIRQNVPTPL